MIIRDYELSEEICLQCMEVAFKRSCWEEWFVNPTAGPWKMIRINDVKDYKLRFAKEEDRPDLIAAHETRQLVLVLEAKDSINGLIRKSNGQIEKSTKVFKSMSERLKMIIEQHKKEIYKKAKVNTELLCGYVFPITSNPKDLEDEMGELSSQHLAACTKIRETSLRPHIIFVISTNAEKDLQIFYTLKAIEPDLGKRVRELLPPEIKELSIKNSIPKVGSHIFLSKTK